jgi:hypothetical protein
MKFRAVAESTDGTMSSAFAPQIPNESIESFCSGE